MDPACDVPLKSRELDVVINASQCDAMPSRFFPVEARRGHRSAIRAISGTEWKSGQRTGSFSRQRSFHPVVVRAD